MSHHKAESRALHDDAPSGAPARVGPYTLCYELGSGGMATVYLGHREIDGIGRFAAVKLLHPHLASDRTFAEMFLDEAEIASRIRHLNVCSVYDFEVRTGASYIAMEYLLGQSMSSVYRSLAKQGPGHALKNARLCAKVLADACQGLHAAHELEDDDGEPLGVVHRDISPGNLMLTFDGVAKVVDFGVASAARKRHRTETGVLKGKLAYIAPELLRGKRADRRSDVWGMGVVAWELLTGKRLFHHANEVDTLRAVMDAPFDPPSVVRPELPGEIDEIVMRALARDRDRRCESARELGRDLARFANGDDVVTSADLAQWIEELFPGTRPRKQEMLDSALKSISGSRIATHLALGDRLLPDESGPHHALPRTPLPKAPSTLLPPPSPSEPPPATSTAAAPAELAPPPPTSGVDAPTKLYTASMPLPSSTRRTRAPTPQPMRMGWVVLGMFLAGLGGASAASLVYLVVLPRAAEPRTEAPPLARPAAALPLASGQSFVVDVLPGDGDALTFRLRPTAPHASEGPSLTCDANGP